MTIPVPGQGAGVRLAGPRGFSTETAGASWVEIVPATAQYQKGVWIMVNDTTAAVGTGALVSFDGGTTTHGFIMGGPDIQGNPGPQFFAGRGSISVKRASGITTTVGFWGV